MVTVVILKVSQSSAGEAECWFYDLKRMIMNLPVMSDAFFFGRCLYPAEPVRPIDPAAWISHTTALTGPYPHYGTDKKTPTFSTQLSTTNRGCGCSAYISIWVRVFSHNLFSFFFATPEFDDLPLSASKTDMATIVKVMQLPDSGLEIRDRMWLKITIANAVIGEKTAEPFKFTTGSFWMYLRAAAVPTHFVL